MIESTLPSAGTITGSLELRRNIAKAISYVEILAAREGSGKTTSAAPVIALLNAAVAALTPYVPA